MKRQPLRWRKTPPSVTVFNAHSLKIKRSLQLKRPNVQEAQGPPGKSHPSQHKHELCCPTMTLSPMLVIQREDMAAFFRLFDDDLIQDFLWMDCCCKITDRYLLAMTFVYFRRARFSINEHNQMNFFIALYLANTMEEDEEESRYEIFPWALGKNWRKHFPRFLKQRDKLWARIQYRAAVSRRCCEEVMAIMPSHFVWQRERAPHHSGAWRRYGERSQVCMPRGPSVSPAPCTLCNRTTQSHEGTGLSISSTGSSVVIARPTSPLALSIFLSRETTPPRNTTLLKNVGKAKLHLQGQPSLCCSANISNGESACGSKSDTSMDWINEE